MRVLISKDGRIDADIYCRDARSAKQVLKEQSVNTLFISNYIFGRENGISVLRWAGERNLLPAQVILTDKRKEVCDQFEDCLLRSGYRSADRRTYFKFH